MTATHAMLEHTATDSQLEARRELIRLAESTPLPIEDGLFNTGLYTRSGVLVKFLLMADLYKRFLHIPGLIVEFGVWYGQNLVLLENLRAIYEPFNKQRRIVGFDTFTGYEGKPGFYDAGRGYKTYLARLLKTHQRCNVYGHQDIDHELVEGDASETVPQYFKDHKDAMVAFAFFDIGDYKPTVYAMQAIKPRLMSGSVLLLDQFTWDGADGEARALRETFARDEYRIEKCTLYPSKAIVTIT